VPESSTTVRRPFAVLGEPIRTSWLTAITVCTTDARPVVRSTSPQRSPRQQGDEMAQEGLAVAAVMAHARAVVQDQMPMPAIY
jgi:hypothetical protein